MKRIVNLVSLPTTLFSIALTLLMLTTAAAKSPPPTQQDRPKPPPEAYSACKGKAEGANVTVTMPRGETMEAVCRMLDGELVATPKEGQRHGDGPPPQPR